jgi:ABC-2 type transport system permease protein
MRKLAYIIQREYITRVRTKTFLITTFLVPLLFIGLPFLMVFILNYSAGSIQNIGISDTNGLLDSVVLADKEDGSMYFKKVAFLSADSLATNSLYDAVLIVPADFDVENTGRSPIRFVSKKRAGMAVRSYINSILTKAISDIKLKKLLGSEAEKIDLDSKVSINFEKADDNQDKSDIINLASAIGYGLGLLIYILILAYGTMIMKGVMEEKTNRIMEVLISSVKPWQLMFGKIIGIGAVGLTQFAIWIVLLTVGSLIAMPILGITMGGSMPVSPPTGAESIDPAEIAAVIEELKAFDFSLIGIGFLVYLIGGFFLYGSLFAAVGAAGADDTNAQTLSMPLTSPIMISFFMMMGALNDPEGSLAFWGSIIPFTSPVIMPALLGFSPPLWQIGLSVVLLFGTIIGVVFLSGKIYRTGILMYGKKVSLKEMVKWMVR